MCLSGAIVVPAVSIWRLLGAVECPAALNGVNGVVMAGCRFFSLASIKGYSTGKKNEDVAPTKDVE